METFFMNTKNNKTSEPLRFKYNLIDKLRHYNTALANLSFYYTWKNVKSIYNNISLKYQHQLGMIHLICLMDRIIYQLYKIISNT